MRPPVSNRLALRLLACQAVAVLAVALSASAIVSARARSDAEAEVAYRLDAATRLARALLPSHGALAADPANHALLVRVAEATECRLTLLGPDGTVLDDTAESPALMGNHLDRPEFRLAREQGSGPTGRHGTTRDRNLVFLALRIDEAGTTRGFVRAALPSAPLDGAAAAARRQVAWGALAGFGVLGAATWFSLRPATKGVHRLVEAARDLEQGRLEKRAALGRGDEVGDLGAAFDAMADALQARFAELQRQAAQLQSQGERLATVLGAMIEGVLAIDGAERILFANRAARQLLDIPTADVVGRPLWEAVRIPVIQQVCRAALAEGQDGRIEFELPRSQATVALLATRLPGRPCPGLVLVLHDVTDLRRLENLRREFVSNVSHELKTPLTSIQAYTETLLSGAVDDPAHNRVFLAHIEEQAERLHALIQDVLRLARIESEQNVFEVERIGIAPTADACLEAHLPVAASKGVALSADPPAGPVEIYADEEGLRTILDNLVDNAINYTPAGGRVVVRWGLRDSQAFLEVEDTGVGIEARHLTRIFERFYRADKARSREVGGTGLGLSIVKHLAQYFGGRIDVESTPGQGSRFTVTLPAA